MDNQEFIDRTIQGISSRLPEETLDRLQKQMEITMEKIKNEKMNRGSNKRLFDRSPTPEASSDPDVYNNLTELLSSDQKLTEQFSSIMGNIYARNKKYFTVLKDYEIMPILIPQINRVLMFLVNETLSPDIQNDTNFEIKYLGKEKRDTIESDIKRIRQDMDLDRMLEDVRYNRLTLGQDYRVVTDYTETFTTMINQINRSLNEGAGINESINQFNQLHDSLVDVIDEVSYDYKYTIFSKDKVQSTVTEKIALNKLNIVIERSPIVPILEEAQGELTNAKYQKYSIHHTFDQMHRSQVMNEAGNVRDLGKNQEYFDQLKAINNLLEKKKLRRASIQKLDPARTFPIKVGGREIGAFYLTDITPNTQTNQYTTTLGQSLKDRLIKSRSTSAYSQEIPSFEDAEKSITKTLAEEIIRKFDPTIGINRIEDIDLLYDYIISNKIYNGNKKLTFYYSDDIINLSRSAGSVLVNAVFFTKLYSMLLLNNIMTAVLRGRGRQIHSVKMGVTNATRKYLNHAIQVLNNPETNLGMIHGSFEQILNPLNSATDILIPSEDGERFITTDYIEGQNVDMQTEFMRFILNSIVTSFGLDNAVLDATNGQIQFAKTLSMESLQIVNSIKSEQNDSIRAWEKLVLRVLDIMGEDDTREAIKNDMIKVSFYSPKSLILQTIIDEINNAKSFAETLADAVPELNTENANQNVRNLFIYSQIKEHVNIDWAQVERSIKDAMIANKDLAYQDAISTMDATYQNNTEVRQFGEPSPEESEYDDLLGSEEDEYGASVEETPTEQEPPEEQPEENPEEPQETERQEETSEENPEEEPNNNEDDFDLPEI